MYCSDITPWRGVLEFLRCRGKSRRPEVEVLGMIDSDMVQQDAMESVMERYRIFMKRFELSEDFMAKMTMEQLKTQLSQFGTTPQQMFDQMHQTLERMKSEIKE